jgi:FMN phosphatase YigB (HAD superfamily)
MDCTAHFSNEIPVAPAEKIYPAELPKVFSYYANKIKVLSLDCFDTLLWRRTATPVDVFYDLQQKPTFKKIGLTALLRARLELQARNLNVIRKKNSEVNLTEIYQAGFPQLTDDEINTLTEEELGAEKEACFYFPPILSLMQEARKCGIKIIIVSNTYLSESQLRRLLTHCLPKDMIKMIDYIFCSCEFEKTKNNGLFKNILEKLACAPEEMLHIGDDLYADYQAPMQLNIHALQLLHFDNNIMELLRGNSTSACIFNPDIRNTRSLISPFRGIFANHRITTPEQMIGYASVGPIIYSFAKFILREVQEQKQTSHLKVLFLLRDAHLPSLICEEITGASLGHRVRISRFSAYAASFRTEEDIDRYLIENLHSGRYADMARQLLLPDEIANPIEEICKAAKNPSVEFVNLIHRKDIKPIIFQKSKYYCNRLVKHLENEVNLKRGDTLMFVDLGYSGTAQRLLEPIFRDELGIHIIGRYLIQLTVPNWEASRRGLIDPSWCDDRSMFTLVAYIALLEQICTSSEKSVIDYDEKGNPLFSGVLFEKNQHEKLNNIQQECIQFAKDAEIFFKQTGRLSLRNLQDVAISEIGRFIFLPTESEVKYLDSFQFDVNLGTHDVMRMVDPAAGLASLKKRGLFFPYMEKSKKTSRTNYPAELRSAGIELTLTLMTQHRFGLHFGFKDISLRRENVKIVVNHGEDTLTTQVEAILTYDGYYALSLPVSTQGFATAIVFGQHYQWIQIENAELIETDAFLSRREALHTENYWDSLSFYEMKNQGGNLYECPSLTSALIIPSQQKTTEKNYLLRLVFRPVVTKEMVTEPG